MTISREYIPNSWCGNVMWVAVRPGLAYFFWRHVTLHFAQVSPIPNFLCLSHGQMSYQIALCSLIATLDTQSFEKVWRKPHHYVGYLELWQNARPREGYSCVSYNPSDANFLLQKPVRPCTSFSTCHGPWTPVWCRWSPAYLLEYTCAANYSLLDELYGFYIDTYQVNMYNDLLY